jgi:hypothetical protein
LRGHLGQLVPQHDVGTIGKIKNTFSPLTFQEVNDDEEGEKKVTTIQTNDSSTKQNLEVVKNNEFIFFGLVLYCCF